MSKSKTTPFGKLTRAKFHPSTVLVQPTILVGSSESSPRSALESRQSIVLLRLLMHLPLQLALGHALQFLDHSTAAMNFWILLVILQFSNGFGWVPCCKMIAGSAQSQLHTESTHCSTKLKWCGSVVGTQPLFIFPQYCGSAGGLSCGGLV